MKYCCTNRRGFNFDPVLLCIQKCNLWVCEWSVEKESILNFCHELTHVKDQFM